MEGTVKLLTEDEARDVYNAHFERDFPPDELKPWVMIRRLLRAGAYRCFGLFDGGALLGYAFFVLNGTDAMLDYFATLPEYRNRGAGSLFLRLLLRETASFENVLAEAEDPASADAPEEQALRKRRIKFYLRNGFADTRARARVFGVDFVLLSPPDREAAQKDAAIRVYAALYRSFLPADGFAKWIVFPPY